MTKVHYEQINPGQSLDAFIRMFWKFENITEQPKHYTILPDGYFDMVIKVTGNRFDSITAFGLWTKSVNIIIPGDTVIMGICFKPLAAEYILKYNIANLLNSFTVLENNFWNIDNIQIDNLRTWAAEITSEISRNSRVTKTLDSRKQNLFNQLFESNGSITVDDLSKTSFWSSRQLNRYFKNSFGLTLKSYSNILRCASTYKDIMEGHLFPKQYFYDQAHFIKEIKRHTGFRPGELHQNKNDRFLQFSTLLSS